MEIADQKRFIQKEMNRRRRHGGAEDVAASLWENSVVDAAVQQATECADSEGFTGNWDYASPKLEGKMDVLAGTLRRASTKQNPYQPITNRPVLTTWQSKLASQHSVQRRVDSEKDLSFQYFPYFPSVVRQDAGGRALAEYLTWHWKNHGWAAALCEQVCGGEYLSRELAWTFLTSDLPKLLGYDDYERLGLCPARAKGRVLSKFLKVDGLFFTTNMVRVDPKSHLVTATTEALPTETGHYCLEVSMPRDHTSIRRLKRLVLTLNAAPYYYITSRDTLPASYAVEHGQGRDSFIAPHPAPYFQGKSRYVEGYTTSVIADLIGIAEMFSGEYSVSIWDMLEACLTGQFPSQPSVIISTSQTKVIDAERPDEISSGKVQKGFSAQGPATLTVQPWVTPEYLADAWREFRQSNPAYSPSQKQADTLQFVLTHTAPGAVFRWDELAKLWQKERGEMMTRSQIFKQFQRARTAILPEYCDLEVR